MQKAAKFVIESILFQPSVEREQADGRASSANTRFNEMESLMD